MSTSFGTARVTPKGKKRNILLCVLFVAGFVACSPFLAQADATRHNLELDVSGYYCLVPSVLAVLLLSPLLRGSAQFLKRILLALWLGLFLWWGFHEIFIYDYPVISWPWTAYFVYTLMLGVPLIVIASRRVAALSLIRLTLCAGFVVVLAYDVLNLAYSYRWFAMYVRLRLGMWETPDATGWASYLLVWLTYDNWLVIRLVTYLCLGYILGRYKGLAKGIGLSALIAVADTTLAWLVFLPRDDGAFEAAPLSFVFQYDLPELLKAMLAQVVVLGTFALLGALVAQVRWPSSLLRPPRFVPVVPATHRRRPPVRYVTLGANKPSSPLEVQ